MITGLVLPGTKAADERIVHDALEAYGKTETKKTVEQMPIVWRIIMKNRITKIALAAVLLVAAGIGVAVWQGDKGIQIPPELARMPVEKLLDIHNDLAESPFEKSLVEAALKSSLDKISARDVLAIAAKNRKPGTRADLSRVLLSPVPGSPVPGSPVPGSRVPGSRVPYVPKPVTEMVEAADVIIHGRIKKVVLDVSDLKEAILKKQRRRLIEEFSSSNIKAEVVVEVFGGYPASPVAEGEMLVLWPVINTGNFDRLKEGGQYLILLKQSGETVWMLPYQEGAYPVDAETEVVSGFRSGPIPLDDAWDFMVSSYEAIHEAKEPLGEDME